jgi:hypothetical protein
MTTAGFGLQHSVIAGKYWQEAEPQYQRYDFDEKLIFLLGIITLEKKFASFGFGLDFFVSKYTPGLGLKFFFKR